MPDLGALGVRRQRGTVLTSAEDGLGVARAGRLGVESSMALGSSGLVSGSIDLTVRLVPVARSEALTSAVSLPWSSNANAAAVSPSAMLAAMAPLRRPRQNGLFAPFRG